MTDRLPLDANLMSIIDLVGANRLEDRRLLTETRTQIMEMLVRARLVAPLALSSAPEPPGIPAGVRPLDDVFGELRRAAPLNWHWFQRCLDRGTASYAQRPPGSCSTELHPQAELFRAFLRPYLRGFVLDIGCGPQPIPHYLRGYSVERIRGIDPISQPADHPFEFVSGVGECLPWADRAFDLVVSGTTLDHFYLLDRAVESIFRVLKPGGRFAAWITEFAGAPAYDPYVRTLERPFDDEHLFHIDRAWFLPLMTGAGFVPLEMMHFELPFNYLFMSFEKPAHA